MSGPRYKVFKCDISFDRLTKSLWMGIRAGQWGHIWSMDVGSENYEGIPLIMHTDYDHHRRSTTEKHRRLSNRRMTEQFHWFCVLGQNVGGLDTRFSNVTVLSTDWQSPRGREFMPVNGNHMQSMDFGWENYREKIPLILKTDCWGSENCREIPFILQTECACHRRSSEFFIIRIFVDRMIGDLQSNSIDFADRQGC